MEDYKTGLPNNKYSHTIAKIMKDSLEERTIVIYLLIKKQGDYSQ